MTEERKDKQRFLGEFIYGFSKPAQREMRQAGCFFIILQIFIEPLIDFIEIPSFVFAFFM